MSELLPKKVLGAQIAHIGHSKYSEPEWIVDGIGPATFRSHFITLSTGLVLDFFTAEITCAADPQIEMPGETVGIPITNLIGRTITALVRDDQYSSLIILDNHIFLNDANDAFTGNPLYAGYLSEYSEERRKQFIDYWTEESVRIQV